jgi:drug/metabolite transporter (DMT)-like permease
VPLPDSVVAASGAALMFALANVAQRRAAAAVPRASGGSVHLFWNLVRNPRWLLGSGCAVGGLLLQTLALARGSLVVVQSILVSGVVVAIVLDAGGDRRRPTWPELVGPVLVVGGVVALVVTGPVSSGEVGLGASVGGLVAVGIVGGAALLAARRHHAGRWTARLLGGAAGTCFALDALFLKELVAGLDAARTEVVAIGVAGFALASVLGNLTLHRGYQLAPLRVVLPTLTGAEPVAAFLLGWLALGESLPGGIPGHLVAVLGVVAAVTGNAVVGLAEVGAGGAAAGGAAAAGAATTDDQRVPAIATGGVLSSPLRGGRAARSVSALPVRAGGREAPSWLARAAARARMVIVGAWPSSTGDDEVKPAVDDDLGIDPRERLAARR